MQGIGLLKEKGFLSLSSAPRTQKLSFQGKGEEMIKDLFLTFLVGASKGHFFSAFRRHRPYLLHAQPRILNSNEDEEGSGSPLIPKSDRATPLRRCWMHFAPGGAEATT